MDDLERTFLDLATERKLLSVEQRDQIEAACGRARSEKQTLTPWRAAFVRGHLSRAEVDKILADASRKVEHSSGEAPILGASADDEAIDHRLGMLALQTRVVTEAEKMAIAVSIMRRETRAGRSPRQLGDVLVSEQMVASSVMEGLLLLQDRLRAQKGRDDSTTEAIACDLRFGQVALDARLLSEKDLDRALAEQKRRSAKGQKKVSAESLAVGNILVDMTILTREARDLVLELQERRAARRIAPAPTTRAAADEVDKLGRVLIESRIVSENQIQAALELQRELREKGIDRRLGDLLVLQGVIDRPTLETALKTQVARKKVLVPRRRHDVEELLPENPITVLLGTLLALILVSAYVLASDGASLLRGTLPPGHTAPGTTVSGERGDDRGR